MTTNYTPEDIMRLAKFVKAGNDVLSGINQVIDIADKLNYVSLPIDCEEHILDEIEAIENLLSHAASKLSYLLGKYED
jgi:hypothetical protein